MYQTIIKFGRENIIKRGMGTKERNKFRYFPWRRKCFVKKFLTRWENCCCNCETKKLIMHWKNISHIHLSKCIILFLSKGNLVSYKYKTTFTATKTSCEMLSKVRRVSLEQTSHLTLRRPLSSTQKADKVHAKRETWLGDSKSL